MQQEIFSDTLSRIQYAGESVIFRFASEDTENGNLLTETIAVRIPVTSFFDAYVQARNLMDQLIGDDVFTVSMSSIPADLPDGKQ